MRRELNGICQLTSSTFLSYQKHEEEKTGQDLPHCELEYEELPSRLQRRYNRHSFAIVLHQATLEHYSDESKQELLKRRVRRRLKTIFEYTIEKKVIVSHLVPFFHVKRFLKDTLLPFISVVVRYMKISIFALRLARAPNCQLQENSRIEFLIDFDECLYRETWIEFVHEKTEPELPPIPRETRKNREQYRSMLKSLVEEVKLNHKSRYVDLVELVTNDRRFTNMLFTTGSIPRENFEEFREHLYPDKT